MKSEPIVQIDESAAQRTRLDPADRARQNAMSPAEIEAAAQSDPDNPPMTAAELGRAGVARRLRRLRARLALSQSAFAARYGIPLANIRQYEIGRTLPPAAVQSYIRVIEAEPERTAQALGSAA